MDTSFGCIIYQNIVTLAEINVKKTADRGNLNHYNNITMQIILRAR